MNQTTLKACAVFVLASLTGIAGLVSRANALPIIFTPPPGTSNVTCSNGLTTSSSSGPSNLSQSCVGAAVWHDSAVANLASLTVQAGSINDGPEGLGGFPAGNHTQATISYYINVVSGEFVPGVFSVPLLVDSTVEGTIGGGGFLDANEAVASVKITAGSKQLYINEVDCSAKFGCPVNTVSTAEQQIDVEISNPYNQLLVTMLAFAQYGSNAPNSAFAFADPFIRIDPIFLAAHPDYSLVFSANIGNGSADGGSGGDTTGSGTSVPEPTPILLMCFGLLIAKFSMRRNSLQRSRKPSAGAC